MFTPEALGSVPPCLFQTLVAPGNPWSVAALPNLCLCVHGAVFPAALCVLFCKNPIFKGHILRFWMDVIFFFFFRFYLFTHERHRERGRDISRGRSRLPVGSSMWGLDPRTPGSCPELKADTQPLSHPGAPRKECSRQRVARQKT